MKKTSSGLASVQGFSFSAVECGIRYENRLDLCLIHSAKTCNASGMFTTNRVFAAPVQICRERINSPINGILINSTNANACTGEEGYKNAVAILSETERLTQSPAGSFLNASTGIIGRQLPAQKIIASLETLVTQKNSDKGSLIPRAIMTTDTKPKESSYEFETSIGRFNIAGTAKGSGMIAPNMATMLSFIITDAPVGKADLDAIFRRTVECTFNSITIDGDMSTNDTALLLSPVSDTPLTSEKDLASFEEALLALCRDLSRQLVMDAEGGTKCVTVTVRGAKDLYDARTCAKSVAQSLLVKTALYGNDPNWGRIACAAGYSGADFSMDQISVSIDGCELLAKGQPTSADSETLAAIMKQSEFTVLVTIGNGPGEFTFLTSDISVEYVKINAEYST